MKRIGLSLLALVLCLTLSACFFVRMPGKTEPTEPKVTVDPNAKPEIVADVESARQEEYLDASGKAVGHIRYTDGTNCGVSGTVRIEYLDANGKVVQAFEPQLPGGTLTWRASSWNGSANKETEQVTEKSDHGTVYWVIEPYTNGKLIYCEYVEGTGRNSRCARIDMYGPDGQITASMQAPGENCEMRMQKFSDPEAGTWTCVDEVLVISETDDGAGTPYGLGTWYFDAAGNLVVEILSDPVTGQYDPLMHATSKRVEIRNGAGKTIGVYEASGPDSRVDAFFDMLDGRVYVVEQALSREILMSEELILSTGKVVYREVNTYDEAGNWMDTQYVYWGGKVVTTPSKWEDLYTKVEFYDANGELKKTVELIEGSAYIHLDFNAGTIDGKEYCDIEFLSKTGEWMGSDSFIPEQQP